MENASAARQGLRQPPTPFGTELRRWRSARGKSQLDLGLDAGVSARHLSFLESGRSQPSREMVLHLATVLQVPLRDQNLLLQTAGYAPVFRETDLGAPEMAGISKTLKLILRQQDPYGAVAVTPRWDVVMANQSFAETLTQLTGRPVTPLASVPSPRPNLLRLLFTSQGLRAQIINWDAVARTVLSRAHREALWNRDKDLEAMVGELAPSLDPKWQPGNVWGESDFVIPIEVRRNDRALRFFNTITTLGAPQDITLQELRIEMFHPADDSTDQFIRAESSK